MLILTRCKYFKIIFLNTPHRIIRTTNTPFLITSIANLLNLMSECWNDINEVSDDLRNWGNRLRGRAGATGNTPVANGAPAGGGKPSSPVPASSPKPPA